MSLVVYRRHRCAQAEDSGDVAHQQTWRTGANAGEQQGTEEAAGNHISIDRKRENKP